VKYKFVDYATQGYTLLVGLLILLFHNATVPHWRWLFASHITILLIIHFVVRRYEAGRSGPVVDFLRHFYPVLLYAWFFSETGWLNRMFFHDYLDAVAIRLDQAVFGFQPAMLFMEKLPYLVVSELFYASYFSYYVMIAGVGFALYARNRSQFFHYVSVVSFVFYFCYAIYILLPIIGPRVFFHDLAEYTLPDQLQRLAPVVSYPGAVKGGLFFRVMAFIYRVFEAPGAALPSSHVAIALCTVWFSFRYLRAIRYVHLVVALLLCLATVYCRYHYAVDVLTGVLTAALLVPLGNWLYSRTSPVLEKVEIPSSRGDG
jgi:membrane-associated phospholipid phosphatase